MMALRLSLLVLPALVLMAGSVPAGAADLPAKKRDQSGDAPFADSRPLPDQGPDADGRGLGATVLHVLRSPEAGYRDMKRRHPGLDPAHYAMKWSLINQEAARLAAKYPSSVHLVTLERLLEAPEESLRRICSWLGIAFDPVVLTPSWRGRSVDPAAMGPFGGVPTLSAGDDRQARESLSEPELSTIGRQCAGARSLLRSLHALDV